MQLFNRFVSPRGLAVFGFEFLLVAASVVTALRVYGGAISMGPAVWNIVLITVVCQLSFYYNELYDLTVVHSFRELLIRLLQAAGVASLALAALYLLIPALILGREVLLVWLTMLVLLMVIWRAAFLQLSGSEPLQERVLILGSGERARTLARTIADQHAYAYRLVGFVEDAPEGGGRAVPGPAMLGAPGDLASLIRLHSIDRIVVALSDRRGHLPIEELLAAKLSGVRVEETETTYERLTGKILLDELKPSWLVFSDGFRARRLTRIAKRSMDLAVSVPALVLASPLMALTASIVRLDSPGPIIYSHDRVGANGRVFRVFKFRSMRTDAERGTPVWARQRDDRVTRVGRFIRLTRLDELPQLWNVIKGDMSLVGPRPERPFFVEQLSQVIPLYQQRHAVKPGLTGWAQVKYRYGASVEDAREKLRFDLYYIKHMSVLFDVTILMDTVKVILLRKGAH